MTQLISEANRNLQQSPFTDLDMESVLNIGTVAVMRWKYNTDNSFDMIFEWDHLSWLGVGLCPTMDDCDMLVLSQSNSQVYVLDTWSKGHRYPTTDTQNDINVVSYDVNTTGYKVRFNRKLNTGDNQDQVLTRGNSYTFSLAYSSSQQMEEHTTYGVFTFTFDRGQFGTVKFTIGNQALLYVHAIILFLSWGIVADFGIIIVRFFKTLPHYLLIHTLCFLFVDLSTIVLVITMLATSEDQDSSLMDVHKILSIVLLAAVVLQHVMGVVMKILLEQKDKKNNQIVYKIKIVHMILGTAMFLLAKININIGFKVNDFDILFVLNLAWTILMVLIRICFTCYNQFNSKIKTKVDPQVSNSKQLSTDQKQLMDLIKNKTPTPEIQKLLPQIEWVVLNSEVYDLTNYFHPGGNYIIQNVLGREVSRFFYGAYGLESTTIKPHTHSQAAYQQLQSKCIGWIDSSPSYNQQFNLINKTNISQNIFQFEFQAQGKQFNLIQDVSQFGQHYSVSLLEVGGKLRMYTQVFSMSPPSSKFRQDVLAYFSGKSTDQPKQNQLTSDTLPLIIKKYNFSDALSAKLVAHTGITFIQGPFGSGLELEKGMKATAFVGGTGILPFIDLLDHLLLKSIYTVLKQKDQSKANQLFTKNDQLGDEFEFTMFATFLKEEEFIGKEWIRELYRINQQNGLKLFNMKIRYSNGKLDEIIPAFRDRFNVDFVKNELNDQQRQIYICGPPGMNSSLVQIFNTINYNTNKVMIV